jgi:hypothetical protein
MGKYIYERNKMKKSQLIEIIRNAVRLELTESLPKIIAEIQQKTEIENSDPVAITKRVLKKEASVTSSKKPTKQLSKNPLINQALNETIGGVPHEGSLVSGQASADKITDFNGVTHDVDELPDHVSSALNRDYSGFMKAVDKKRGVSTLG